MEEPQIFTLDNAGPTPVSCTKLEFLCNGIQRFAEVMLQCKRPCS